MSKLTRLNPLTFVLGVLLLIPLAGIQPASAADIEAQAQAARVLQPAGKWISSHSSSGKSLAPQQQAQRVFQPYVEGFVAKRQESGTTKTPDAHIQAARVLSGSFY